MWKGETKYENPYLDYHIVNSQDFPYEIHDPLNPHHPRSILQGV